MSRRPPRSSLFPYPALFRSEEVEEVARAVPEGAADRVHHGQAVDHADVPLGGGADERTGAGVYQERPVRALLGGEQPVEGAQRSEEHTSELQSRQYLVCRLL